MTTITIEGTHQNSDASFPDGTTIRATLMTAFMFSGGSLINKNEVSTAIDNGDGTFSLILQVPDDASESANYHFALPDTQTFYADVNQSSSTAWTTFVAAATA